MGTVVAINSHIDFKNPREEALYYIKSWLKPEIQKISSVEKFILGQLARLTPSVAQNYVFGKFLRDNETLESFISRYWGTYSVIQAILIRFNRFSGSNREECFDSEQKPNGTWQDILESATNEFWKRNSVQKLLVHKCIDQMNENDEHNLISQLLTTANIPLATYIDIYRQAGKTPAECQALATLAEDDSNELFNSVIHEANQNPKVKYTFLSEVHKKLGNHSNIILFTDIILQAINDEMIHNISRETVTFVTKEVQETLESIMIKEGFSQDVIQLLADQEIDLTTFDTYDTERLRKDLKDIGVKLGPLNKIIKLHESRVTIS